MTMSAVEEPITEYLFSLYGTAVTICHGVAPAGRTGK